MPVVMVRDKEPIESALRKFKKQCDKEGILSDVRKREFYDKPSVKKKKKSIAARKKVAKAMKMKFKG